MITPLTRQKILKEKSVLSRSIDEHFESEVTFLQQLIRAKSANLSTAETSAADDPVEAEVAAIICEQMHSFGWQPDLIGVSSHRRNVLYVRAGKTEESKTLIL